MDGEILFLCHRTPFPPDRGDKIRSYHVLRALSAMAPVHVGCLADGAADLAQRSEVGAFAASLCMPRRAKPLPLAGVEALATGRPVSLAAFHSRRLQEWVRQTIQDRPITAIYVFSGQMGQYVPADWQGRLVVDLVDVDSAKFEAYGDNAAGPRAWIDRREGRLLHLEEARLVRRADATLLVSEAEAALLRQRVGPGGNIRAIGNGIDADSFDPATVTPAELTPQTGPHLLFTGQMDYAPNVEAVRRMAERIMPVVRRSYPDACFHIVGRAPASQVTALNGQHGTVVHGEVADMRPYLAAADMVCAPLSIARGVQNKVLEAMAMARPVIVSPEAATGIDAVAGKHLLIADSDQAFAEAAIECLSDSEQADRLGQAARERVVKATSWEASLAPLAQIMQAGTVVTKRAAA